MRREIINIIGITLLLFVFSCDVIEDPFPPNLDVGERPWDDSATSEPNNGLRYVLMEEYTGHTCTNCPQAAAEVDRLRNKKYGKKFIPISIHATETFAAPKELPGSPPGSYQSDHRADESLDYENEEDFGILLGLPRAMISRRGDAPKSVTMGKWVQECNKIYETSDSVSVADINIKTYFYSQTSEFKVQVEVEWIEEYMGGMNLQVQIIEDSIIDWQLDGSEHIENYEFKHMFRGSINGSWGSPLESAPSGSSTVVSYTRSIEPYLGRIRNKSLNDYEKDNFDDWHIIAFIYKDAPEYEVMQVNEAPLTSAGK